MKKIITLMLVLALAVSFAGCSAKEKEEKTDAVSTTAAANNDAQVTTKASAYKSSGKGSGKSFEPVLNANEFVLYNNIFYNNIYIFNYLYKSLHL